MQSYLGFILQKIPGVKQVEALVMMNKISVEIDNRVITANEVKERILEIAQMSGFGGKIVFSRN